jgi:hypothetical protein
MSLIATTTTSKWVIRNYESEKWRKIMRCAELDKLEAQNIEIRTRARTPGLSDADRERLAAEEVAMIFKIKDHQSFGHDGQPCPGE